MDKRPGAHRKFSESGIQISDPIYVWKPDFYDETIYHGLFIYFFFHVFVVFLPNTYMCN